MGNQNITFPLITSLLEVRMRDCLGKYHLDLIPEDIMSIFQKWKLLWHELSKIQSISKKLLSTCTPRPVLGTMIEKILLVCLCLRHKVNKFSVQHVFCYPEANKLPYVFALSAEFSIPLRVSVQKNKKRKYHFKYLLDSFEFQKHPLNRGSILHAHSCVIIY